MKININKHLLKAIKITFAALFSIAVSNYFNLKNPLAAGIISILSVLETNKASIEVGIKRILSSVVALAVAFLCFYFFGFEFWVFALYLFLYTLSASFLNLTHALAPASVLVTHILLTKDISSNFLINEFLLMVIGCLFAIVFNLYMPSNKKELERINNELQKSFTKILYSFEILVVDINYKHNLESELKNAKSLIEKGIELSKQDLENEIFKQGNCELAYFKMRLKQYYVLVLMKNRIKDIKVFYDADKIGRLLHITALKFHKYNDCQKLMEEVDELFKYYSNTNLPKDRFEFEQRAILFQMLNDFKTFLLYKRSFVLDYAKDFEILEYEQQ